MPAGLTVTASPRADAGWAGAPAEPPAPWSWVCTGRAPRKVKCMAKRAALREQASVGGSGHCRGVLAVLIVGPAHLPPAPHRTPTSLGAPGAESSLSLDASQATRLTLDLCANSGNSSVHRHDGAILSRALGPAPVLTGTLICCFPLQRPSVRMCTRVCVQASACVSVYHAHAFVRAEGPGGAGRPWTASHVVRSVIGSLGWQLFLPLGRVSRAGSRSLFLAKSPTSCSPLASPWGRRAALRFTEGAPIAEG